MALVPAFGRTYSLNAIASTETTFAIAGGGTGSLAAGTIVIRAAAGNNTNTPVLWGFGGAVQELAPGEGVAVDVPPGYAVDLQDLRFSGNGNTGQVVFVTAILLP